MTTERLYYDDSYQTEFEAEVVAARPGGWAALNRSAFYPTSGGQPFDTGILAWDGGEARVTDVEVEQGVVWHQTDKPLKVGAPVKGTIDWARRFDHMQQHAADHMLAGAAWQMLRGVTIGLHLGRENSTIDLELPGGRTRLTAEEAFELEMLVNRRAQQDDPIRCWFPSPEELAALPLRKQPTVSEHVRVVAMGDYEMVPCGGTHPRSTGQIGPIKILSWAPARGKLRLCFVAGMRATALFHQAYQSAGEMAAALSADLTAAPEALRREREAVAARRKETREQLIQAALEILRAGRQGTIYSAHLAFADHEILLGAAAELTKDPKAAALLSCPKGAGRLLVFARGSEAAWDMAQLLRASGAKGGGKPDMAQGSAPDGDAVAQALRTLQGG